MKIFIFLFFIFFLASGNVFAESKSQFREQVDKIIGDPTDIISYGDFAYLPKFIKLSEQREKNFQSCMNIISDSTTSFEEKQIAILLLNKISPEHYFIFLDKLFSMYKSGHLNKNNFYTALFPEHPFHTFTIEDYKMKSDRIVLTKMINCNCLGKNTNRAMTNALSGKLHRQLVQFHRDNAYP